MPHRRWLVAPGLGFDGDFLRHHKRRIKTDAELTDDVVVVVDLLIGFEIKAAALGDGAKVVFQLFRRHADACVFNGDGARVAVWRQTDVVIVLVEGAVFVAERLVINLVDGVAGVRDQLAQENFTVGVNGMDHQIHESLRFCFEGFPSHCWSPRRDISTRVR